MVKNVLIVDDDQEMLLALKNGFVKYKETFSVLIAEDGLTAVEKLKKNTVSLVVTDLKMPRMDGFGLLEHIMEHYPDIPVIIITGYSTPQMEKLAREGGAVGYIAKPFMLENLARHIMITLRKESEGGTLHSVSSGIFLQLMEMEQKTCTIRLDDKTSNQKGVLFFKDGELLDARVGDIQGKKAAYLIFAWEEVTISIQNVCPQMDNKIKSDLQPLILEAMRLKDESDEAEKRAEKPAPEKPAPEKTAAKMKDVKPPDTTTIIRQKLEKQMGEKSGLEDIYKDDSWNDIILKIQKMSSFFQFGGLRLGYIDKGEANDFIIIPTKKPTVISVNPKCPRDKIIQILSQ